MSLYKDASISLTDAPHLELIAFVQGKCFDSFGDWIMTGRTFPS